jgi:hypothetical protein
MVNDGDTAREVICLRCGYDLRGLAVTGVCPECGTLIERSLHGNLLAYSDETYRAALHRGVIVILSAIAAQVILIIAMFAFLGIVVAWGSGSMTAVRSAEIAGSVLMTGCSFVLLYGWWLFSSPDPAFVGRDEGGRARVVVRVALVIRVFATPLDVVVDTGTGGVPSALLGPMEVVTGGVLIGAWVLMFFASMLYIRWLAPRLPDPNVDKRAKLLMWLGPLLWIIGCGIGGVVALVLYWNLLNWVRLDIRRIRSYETPA